MKVYPKMLTIIFFLFFSQLTYSVITTTERVITSSEHNLELTRQIRKAILADTKLSNDAHNIKIIAIKDAVILEGRVASRAEKVQIENLARARTGRNKVYNRLKY